MKIRNRVVAPSHPCFVIAEIGVNHNGDLKLAKQLIDLAKEAGVDAVKFQHFYPEEIALSSVPQAAYQKRQAPGFSGQKSMLDSLSLPVATQDEIRKYCLEKDVIYLCTPYDPRSVRELTEMGVDAIKIASTDVTNLPLLRLIDQQGVPIILSTGMSDLSEVEKAVSCLSRQRSAGNVALLQCTTEYPSPMEECNLRAIKTMADHFDLPVGFSDHTVGIDAAAWAVASGALLIEKHFTLSRDLPGPDHKASLEPEELAAMVRQIRTLERAFGDGQKRLMPSELHNKTVMQKRIVSTVHIPAGTLLQEDMFACKRAGSGLSASLWDDVMGGEIAVDLPPHTPLEAHHLQAKH